MKIAIDSSPVIYGTGVSVYTKNLIKNLIGIDKENTYRLIGYSLRRFSELEEFSKSIQANFEKKFIQLPPLFFELLWNKLHKIKLEYVFGKCDIYHSSDWVQAPSNALKVTTIHDLVPVLYPHYSLPKIVNVNRRRIEHVRREVDKIIVPSKQTKNDLLGLGFDGKKIYVVPEAVGEEVVPADSIMKASVKRKFLIDKPFFLAIGITPRKNLNRIVQAFRRVNKNRDFKLVVVGEAKINVIKDPDIIFTGFVQRIELNGLLSSSIALVYPSLYEGFGLPILEALKCNTAVVTSNFGSMLELGKHSSILVDPYSVESIEEGMRKSLSKKCNRMLTEDLKTLSWKNTAQATLVVYKGLSGK